jgi:hypothetical protein
MPQRVPRSPKCNDKMELGFMLDWPSEIQRVAGEPFKSWRRDLKVERCRSRHIVCPKCGYLESCARTYAVTVTIGSMKGCARRAKGRWTVRRQTSVRNRAGRWMIEHSGRHRTDAADTPDPSNHRPIS